MPAGLNEGGTFLERPAENKMGVMPINSLLLNMAVPMMLSMMVQALYNVVDSIFVSKLSQDALNAVSLAFPVQNLMIAVGAGTAVGINALLSRSLGQKDQERADKTAMNGIFLALCSAAVFTLLGLFGSRLFFSVQTDIPGIYHVVGITKMPFQIVITSELQGAECASCRA